MNRTKIEYLDYTWNPIVGCSGLGCAVAKVCWAAKQARRRKGKCDACYSFVPHVHWERLDQPIAVKKQARIGVCFSGEFYDREVSEGVRCSLYLQMYKAYWHNFIVFTKQPQNIIVDNLYPRLSIGVSVNRQCDSWRVDAIRDLPVNCRIVSAEPVYENINLNLKNIDLLIIGAQKRPDLQPKPEWVENLIQFARIYGAKVFLKDNFSTYLFPLPTPERLQELPEQLCITPFEKQHHRLEVRSK